MKFYNYIKEEKNKFNYYIKKSSNTWKVYQKSPVKRLVQSYKTKKEAVDKLDRLNKVNEDITIPINVGDIILGGKFKNKRIVVKEIGKNEKGDITINGKPLLKFRIIPKEEKEE